MEFNVASKLLDACVLGIVASCDTYGYDLTQKLGASIKVSETALYPVLRRLSKEGFLTTYDKAYNGRNRKYYTITPEGKQKLEYYKSNWIDHKKIIDDIFEGRKLNVKERVFKKRAMFLLADHFILIYERNFQDVETMLL